MHVTDRQQGIVFKDRKHAGELLAAFLTRGYKQLDPLILGIPRGGVEVAWQVAKKLHAPFAMVIAKKLGFPGRSEFAFGAIAEDHSVYISDQGKDVLEKAVIDQVIAEQSREIDRRVKAYRQGKPLPEMTGRTVIVVDDGIATGATLVPVIRLCRKKKAVRIIIGAPVSGTSFDPHLQEADKIEVLIQPPDFYAVGQVYQEFGDFSDQELLDLIGDEHINK